MMRHVRQAIVLLLLGAIVNIAVAWGCALWSPLRLTSPLVRAADGSDQSWWQDRPRRALAPSVSAVWDYSGRGCRYQMNMADRSGRAMLHTNNGQTTFNAFSNALMDRAVIVRAGFPAEAVSGDRWDFAFTLATPIPSPASPIASWQAGDQHHAAISIERPRVLGGSSFRMLGWRPIWPGFALNTIFYALILWLLFAALFALRRRRRSKRGLCPACAYPIGANAVCTECGSPRPRAPFAREWGSG